MAGATDHKESVILGALGYEISSQWQPVVIDRFVVTSGAIEFILSVNVKFSCFDK